MEIHASARKHGVAHEDIVHAVQNALATEYAREDPDRWLFIGPDRAVNLLENSRLDQRRRKRACYSRYADEGKVSAAARAMKKRRTYGYTRSGKAITDKEIEALAAEAERGYDVDKLVARRGKRGRPTLGSAPASVESVRLDPELRKELADRAQAEGRTTSDVIREAIRQFLRAG